MIFSSEFLVILISVIAKIAILLGIAFNVAPIMTWVERRQAAFIQRRIGPNRVGFFKWRLLGLGQPVADSIKLFFKEDFIPAHVNKFFYFLAPILASTMAFMALMVIPFGSHIEVLGQTISLQVVSLNVGFLYLLAISGLGVYAVALAGWSSNNKYALLGGLRSAAQMISYELAMGLALVPPVLIFGTFDLQQIISMQSYGLWGIIYAPISFGIFLITIFAETNRLPFDLAEGESELVAGFLVEYGGMRWSQFFLGEYTMMFTLSAFCVSLFLGGYELPFVTHDMLLNFISNLFSLDLIVSGFVVALINLIVLIVKVGFFMLLFGQIRFTLPRFRYDQLMHLGWYVLLPISVINIIITAIVLGIMRF